MAHAAQVSHWTPSNLSYRLLEVELGARLGRSKDALRALEAMESDLGVRTRDDPRVIRLRRALRPK